MRRRISVIALAVLLVAVIGTGFYIGSRYKITTVYVEGNEHYTAEEIKEIVMEGRLGKNSLYLSLKYRNKGVRDVPFVQKMDVTIMSPDTIKITVYEKAVAGYVEYLGRYMYFDRDGIIVESSDKKTASVPQVTGLSFEHMVLYEKLPVENAEIFKQVLNTTQLLEKYGILADRIYFDSAYSMTLYFGQIKAAIGSNEYLDEKIMRLKEILDTGELADKSGTLRMESYSEETRQTTFEID